MVLVLGRDLDPLDLELVERAFECVSEAIKTDEFETDEELEIAMRLELAEIVRSSGVGDADALLDLLLDSKSNLTGDGTGSRFRLTSVGSMLRERKRAA